MMVQSLLSCTVVMLKAITDFYHNGTIEGADYISATHIKMHFMKDNIVQIKDPEEAAAAQTLITLFDKLSKSSETEDSCVSTCSMA